MELETVNRRVIEIAPCAVGDRVRLTQQIPRRTRCIVSTIEGRVVAIRQQSTGAWYAHSRDEHLWVDRIVITEDDGAVSDCILDGYSRIDQIADRSGTRCSPAAGVRRVTDVGWSRSIKPAA